MKLNREYQAALASGDTALAEQLEIQLQAAQQELQVNKSKLDLAGRSDSEITAEDVSQALLLYGDQIYASVTDKLSDAMLYGSPTGQWAIAYLESHDMEVTPEHIRDVVAMADDYQTYEAMLARQEVLGKELEKAKKTAEELKKKGGVQNESCAAQLEKMAAAYELELARLRKDIKKKDPGREVKLRELRKQLEDLRAERAKLVSVITPDRDTYTKKKEYDTTVQAEKSIIQAEEARMNRVKSESNSNIRRYEEWQDLLRTGQIDYYENDLNRYEGFLRNAQDKADEYKAQRDRYSSGSLLYNIFDGAYQSCQEKADEYRRVVEYLQVNYGELIEANQSEASKQAYITRLDNQIQEEKDRQAAEQAKSDANIAAARTKRQNTENYMNTKGKEWDDSEVRRKELDAQIRLVEDEIAEYY